jgi:CRISPR system Cascade subunit CasE
MTALTMLRVPIDLNALARYADGRSWTKRLKAERESDAGFDEGRALHHVLDETFGPGALRPFRLMAARDATNGSIYAYTTQTEADIRDAISAAAPPEARRIIGLDRLDFKDMPTNWTAGRRLGFDVRIRAIVRIKNDLPNPRQPDRPYKPGAELDAFFVEAQRTHPNSRPTIVDGAATPSGMAAAGRTREAVYRDWLAARFGEVALLDPERTGMQKFHRTRVARDGRYTEGPDATFHGELIIVDPIAFESLLAHGVGRHKAYGYGMLLLRQAGRPPLSTKD